MASKLTYLGSRRTRNASYTPAARGGMLLAAERELRAFSKPQTINKTWWEKRLGFRRDYQNLTNGITPWATLRVMMIRNADEGKGIGTRFVRFKAGIVARKKYDQKRRWYRATYGTPMVSTPKSPLKQYGCLTIVTATCNCCDGKNDHAWYEAA